MAPILAPVRHRHPPEPIAATKNYVPLTRRSVGLTMTAVGDRLTLTGENDPDHPRGNVMFLANCTSCGRRELRSLRGIRTFTNTVHGWELQFQCRACGAEVVERGRRTPLGARQEAVLAAGNPAAR